MSGKTKRDRSNRNLAQFGIFDIPSMDNGADDAGEDNDSDLEAELLALSTGRGAKPKRPPPKKPAPTANLDAMVAASLKDIPSDEELSGDDDDPDLLNELSEITGGDVEESPSPVKSSQSPSDTLTLLQNRLQMYQAAEANAKQAGETGRARRFGRGIGTIKDLIKQSNAGKAINNDDIPPEVSVNIQKSRPDPVSEPTPSRPAPSVPSPTTPPAISSPTTPPSVSSPEKPSLSPENEELLKLLNTRKDEYKAAALQAKRAGDAASAVKHIKVAKQFEMVIQAVQNGQPVDLSQMPGPPQESPSIEQNEMQTHSEATEPPPQAPVAMEEATEDIPKASLITASSVAEALQQRLEVYQKQEQAAKEQGNASKARRMGRIVKQFQDAIKLNNAGKPIPVEDLPTPPGYAPIPVAKPPEPPKPAVVESPTQPQPPPSRPAQPKVVKKNSAQSRIDKQVALLKDRQREFKEAALNAKVKGDMVQAKEYLKAAKGFDPLIDAAQGGLPVDMSSLPVPPTQQIQLDEEEDSLLNEDIDVDMDPEHLDILSRLEQQLTKQLKMALSTRDHNKAIGDVAGTNRFEQLALSVTRDLDIIRLAKRKANKGVPKFHYETKSFSIVKSFTDLNDNDLQLTIIRGVNYSCSNPDSIDTYVKFEFPYPQEEPPKNKTAIVKNTNNPQYDESFTLPIQRSARQCLRVFKRHSIKLEIYSKGGFFRGDTLIGTANVKLQPLETQCEVHDSFDLFDGRKKVGGKLEVRVRVRDPLATRQIEQLSEKWLVLDH